MLMERRGRIEDMDRSFDIKYWQAQPESDRFAAAWELVVQAYMLKGRDGGQLRLQRSVERLQRQPG